MWRGLRPRHQKRGVAAFGRATSFVVSFVVAMNRVDVVAVNTIFVLRLSKTGRTVGQTDSRLDGSSVARTHLEHTTPTIGTYLEHIWNVFGASS